MSSPENAGTQVHPANTKDKQLFMGESLHEASDIKGYEHEKQIYASRSTLRHRSPSSSKSVQTAFTGGFSSEEEDSDVEKLSSNMSKRMTRSLGRNEMKTLFRGCHEIVPVSERTSAYKELVTSAQHTWTSPKQSPRHSAVKVGNEADTSTSQSRITSNPFFQLDRLGKLPADSGHRRNTSPATSLNAINKDLSSVSPSAPTQTQSASHSAIGMSVQMRIKIWTEKEKEADKQVKLVNRRSLQSSTLLNIQCSPPDAQVDTRVSSKEECTAHSDDEMIKGRKTHTRENIYEEIADEIKTHRIKEASTSSESSANASPSKTSGKNKRKKILKKAEKKEADSNSKPKQSKWKLRSPLQKRKVRVSNGTAMKEKQRSREDEEDVDDVFSPTGPQSDKTQIVSKHNHTRDLDELPSLFDQVNSSTPPSNKKRSISHEILDIIDSLGTVENNHAVSISITHNSHSDSDSENEKEEQSSLDTDLIARQALKRRASDGYRMQLGVRESYVKGRKGSLSPFEESAEGVVATALMYADAVWDRNAEDSDELSFRVGDVIEILDMTDDMWWHGSVGETSGWFPASFVRLRVGQDSESEDGDSLESTAKVETSTPNTTTASDCLSPDHLLRHSDPTPDPPLSNLSSSELTESSDKVAATLPKTFPRRQGGGTTRRRMTIRRKDPSSSSLSKKLTPEQVRAKIIEEIISTERDYVRHLEDIIEGYLKRCREYNKLFDEEQIDIIFSNVEQVYKFQRDFLKELEAKINSDHIEESEIGEVFTNNQHEFKVYSHYCNNHPHAVSEMSSLQEIEQYSFFFESCRLLRNLQDISLEGFLLTPVQKICKYPLQLSELLKYTDETHPDHSHVVDAQKAMKNVAMLINEQKRRIENMGKIGCWQKTIEGWKGPDILETSTELIHYGELHKISKGHSQERHFFLFDHQLVYCKKDAIGGKLGYKGRVDLDNCQIADIADNAVLHGSTPVKNCWRMNNKAKDNKWYVIFAKSPQVKEEWMKAFQRERERVKEDEEKGFYVSLKMKNAAVSLCATNSDTRKRGKSVKKHVAFNESVDGSAGSKKLAATVSGTSSVSQATKKSKTAKRKTHSVSGTASSKVIF